MSTPNRKARDHVKVGFLEKLPVSSVSNAKSAWRRRLCALVRMTHGTFLEWHRESALLQRPTSPAPDVRVEPSSSEPAALVVPSRGAAGAVRLHPGASVSLSDGALTVSSGGSQLVLRATAESAPGTLEAWEREIVQEAALARRTSTDMAEWTVSVRSQVDYASAMASNDHASIKSVRQERRQAAAGRRFREARITNIILPK